jgi:hypothetical protein
MLQSGWETNGFHLRGRREDILKARQYNGPKNLDSKMGYPKVDSHETKTIFSSL